MQMIQSIQALENGGAVFFTPERVAREQFASVASTRGRLLIASCRSGSRLATRVVQRYHELAAAYDGEAGLLYLENIDFQFSDSETLVRLTQHIGGHDVFLFQALLDPTSGRSVDENYMAFLVAARAFCEHGAGHVTGVLPYLAYSRQDRPDPFQREPTTAKLMADLSVEAGIDRLITWHPHGPQIRGFYGGTPMEMLDPLLWFLQEFGRFKGRSDVIVVAPDAGAAKLVGRLSRHLDLHSAMTSKYRPQPEQAVISEIVGDFGRKHVALVVDDMISSGGTVYALIRELVEEKDIREVHLAASHNLCMERARERLIELHEDYHLQEVVVTNSVPQTPAFSGLPFFAVRDLSDIFSRTINRVHYSQSVSELFVDGV